METNTNYGRRIKRRPHRRLCEGGEIILKWTLQNSGFGALIGLIWLMVATGAGSCERDNEPPCCIKYEQFLG
jgi:hypothetical protein